jgi:tetratricopeptide (TPR) repeat protein
MEVFELPELAPEVVETEPVYREALALRLQLFSGDHPAVATSMNNLGCVFMRRGELVSAGPVLAQDVKAEALFRAALATNQRLFKGDHPAVASTLFNLGKVLYNLSNFTDSEYFLRESLAMRRRLFAADHPDVQFSLSRLSLVLYDVGQLEEAESLGREALAMSQRLYVGDHSCVASNLNSLGVALSVRGELITAEPYLREALAMYQRLYPGDHAHVARGMGNLAYVVRARGDLVEAERLFRDALAMYRRVHPDDHADVARGWHNLAYVLQARGNLAEAEPLLRDALAMRRRLFPGDYPDVARSLSNLALVLWERGDFIEAESLCREALAMYQRLFPSDNPHKAAALSNLAAILRSRGDEARAEELGQEALAMRRRLFPGAHPDLIRSLANLGSLARDRADRIAAEILYREALEMGERLRTRIIGVERERAEFGVQLRLPEIATSLAHVLIELDRPADAFAVTERGRARAFLDLLERADRDLVAEFRAAGNSEAAERLDAALAAEDRIRQELTRAEALLVGRRREREALAKRDDLTSDQRAQRPGELDKQIESLVERVKSLRALEPNVRGDVLALLRELHPDAKPLDTQQVRRGLSDGDLLLAYSWADEQVFVQLVPPADHGDVTGIGLTHNREEVAELTRLAERVRQNLAARPKTENSKELADAQKLAGRLLPAALRKQILAADRVVTIPDGPLHGIPLEALPIPSARVSEDVGDSEELLVDAGPNFVYTPSATVYLNRRASHRADGHTRSALAAGDTTALLLGDPVFRRDVARGPACPSRGALILSVVPDGTAAQAGLARGDILLTYDGHELVDRESLTAAQTAVKQAIQNGERSVDQRAVVTYWRAGEEKETTLPAGELDAQFASTSPADELKHLAMRSRGEAEKVAEASALDQIRLHGGSLVTLPGTGQEAAAIAELLRAAGRAPTLLLGREATVRRLNEAVQGMRIVHLATHGLTGSVERPYDASLALTQPETPTPDDIGFLTLDYMIRGWRGKLKGCELVVLSACDTQRGVKVGDTVMVLPWGFMYAGAPTVVASLWKVDDTATALLMMRFYENLLGIGHHATEPRRAVQANQPCGGMSKAEALRQAKRWLRALTRENAEDVCKSHELAWVSSLARGEPGPLNSDGLSDHPFRHPYYWSAFILMGDAE